MLIYTISRRAGHAAHMQAARHFSELSLCLRDDDDARWHAIADFSQPLSGHFEAAAPAAAPARTD